MSIEVLAEVLPFRGAAGLASTWRFVTFDLKFIAVLLLSKLFDNIILVLAYPCSNRHSSGTYGKELA